MHVPFRHTHAAATLAWLALALGPAASRADDTPAPNDGQRYVSVGAQADDRDNRRWLSTLSLPVGRQAWVQAGVGQSRSDPAAGGRNPDIVTGAVGVAGQSVQLTVNASHRVDGSRYRQTDAGASLDWRHPDGHVLGVDVNHRSSRAAGTVTVTDSAGGSSTVPALARISGNGVGVHGTLQASAHVSVYGAVARNHYKSTTEQVAPAAPGGPLGFDPALARALLGESSVVNRDEAALDHAGMVGASYRWEKVAVAGEYTTGRVHDDGGAMRSVELKVAVDVAPGWRLASGVGRGTSEQGGRATYASLAVTHGW